MIQNRFLDKIQKLCVFTIVIFFSMILTLSGNPPDYELNSMLDTPVNLRKLPQYPALIIIAPLEETLERASDLYQKLSQTLRAQTYLLISPDLPFYRSQSTILSTFEQTVDDEIKSGVLLDWNRDVARHLFAENSDLPVVLLLEEDGTILGRYHYELVTDAFEFIAHTFATLLPFNSRQLWANSSAEEPLSLQGIQ